MKVLLSSLHHANFRNFESVVVELVARGHQVHLAADEPETMGGQQLAERLAATYPGVTWDFAPSLEDEPWFDAARRLRLGLDYARILAPEYADAPKLRLRTEDRTPRLVRWGTAVPGIGPAATRAALKRIERAMPTSARTREYLQRHSPDVVVLASLTYSRSQQMEQLKAARALGIPVAAAVMSWDHLSSKALLHVAPDMVLVWNDVMRREAVDMHGLSADRIVVTGAQCYDEWFTRPPARSRQAFCEAMGLRADRPFVLWVNSTFNPQIDPPEPDLVVRWLDALRSSSDPTLRELGVLVRPHPERLRDWRGYPLDRFENVAFHGGNPINPTAKNDYFDALHYSAAVVGLATSAFLEAAIAGRTVLALTPPEYKIHQQAMLHFRYLTSVAGGLLHVSPDMAGHLPQLLDAVRGGAARDERNRRFVTEFVRPQGLDVPGTPLFADALERLARDGARPDPTLPERGWLRPIVAAVTARAHHGVVRWLLLDRRGDVLDEGREQKSQVLASRAAAAADRRRAKAQQQEEKARRDARRRRVKGLASVLRRARYLTAVTTHRALALAGLRRDDHR